MELRFRACSPLGKATRSRVGHMRLTGGAVAWLILMIGLTIVPVAAAESATPPIVGPERVAVGKLVVLRVAETPGPDDGEAPVSITAAGWLAISPPDLEFTVFDHGRTCAFSSGTTPGRIVVVVARVGSSSSVPGVTFDRHVVEVVPVNLPDPAPPGPLPPGPTPPNPQPDPPSPDVPDDADPPADLTELGQDAWRQAHAVIPATARVVSPQLAGNYRQVAASLRDRSILLATVAYERLREANQKTLTAANVADAWTGFHRELSARLRQEWDRGAVKTLDDVAGLFDQIAAGLDAVR